MSDKKLKFQNVYGREGIFTHNGRKYSFVNGIFQANQSEKELIKFLKDSSAWIDYVPTAEDKVKDLKAENEELKKALEETSEDKQASNSENEELKKKTKK